MWRKSKILKAKKFIACIKAEDIYADIVEDTEKRFDPSNYELVKPLPKGEDYRLYEGRIRWKEFKKESCNNFLYW